jgi:hypothetical protein
MDYVVPLKTAADQDVAGLAGYLRSLAGTVDVLVVDGSEPAVFARNRRTFGRSIRQVPPLPELRCANGKVSGVRTGLRLARSAKVVLADDDVRYDPAQLRRLERELDTADLVRPQNYFRPLPWHARWDTARIALNRAFGGDYPGTLALRVTDSLRLDGYEGDVLFENLELIRTVRAAGGRERVLLDLYVPRCAPTTRHFRRQRIRQAYDSLAQPPRYLAELAVLPVGIALWRRRSGLGAGAAVGAVLAATEFGRRRAGGAIYFPATTAVWAVPWLVERGCCAWIALALRLSGHGVGYAGHRLLRAGSSGRRLSRAARRPVAAEPVAAEHPAACASRRRTA